MTAVALITSGAYVDPEIAAEFGQIPPSFLPFGHQRLYRNQIASLKAITDRLAISIPSDFDVEPADLRYLQSEAVDIVRAPVGRSLGFSVLYALLVARVHGPVRILHGDTLFLDPLPDEMDVVGVSPAPPAYSWAKASARPRPLSVGGEQQDDNLVLNGYFSFSDAAEFARQLIVADGDFVRAIEGYASDVGLGTVRMADWLDCGHLLTYYRSRARASTARSFNQLRVEGPVIEKQSAQTFKLSNEALWFENVPDRLRMYTPQYMGRTEKGYRIAYEYLPTLHELYVFGRLSERYWDLVFSSCFDFLNDGLAAAAEERAALPGDVISSLVIEKSLTRLHDAERLGQMSLGVEYSYAGKRLPTLPKIAEELADIVREGAPCPSVMHGDFCFPNILYDFRRQQIKLIDPRGSYDDRSPSCFGDLRYDLAKLSHSLEGYDLILADRFTLQGAGGSDVEIRFEPAWASQWAPAAAGRARCNGKSLGDRDVVALTSLLFLSMIPLHSDRVDRQSAFLANALRLYAGLS